MYCHVILFIINLVLLITARDPGLRITGGSDVDDDELPFVARIHIKVVINNDQGRTILEKEHYLCSCSILTPVWSLTAGHCLLTENPSNFTKNEEGIVKLDSIIRYGPLNQTQSSEIVKWLRHPAYKNYLEEFDSHLVNDISLMKTKEITLKQYGYISGVDYVSLVGLEATAAGYGIMNASGEFNHTTALGKPLQKLDVVVTKCNEQYEFLRPRLCLARRCGKEANICPGDSGGPLLHLSGIIGVTSGGPRRCNPIVDEPLFTIAGMTPISPFIDWIADVMNRDAL